MSRSVRAHLLLFCVVGVWGSTFVLVKSVLRDISPLLFNLLRMALAFLCLAVLYRAQWRRIRRAGWISGAVLGFVLAVAYQFQTAGLKLTTPSNSAFITGLTLVLVPALGALPGVRRRGSRPPSWNVWLGVVLAFSGVVLLAAPPGNLTGIDIGDLLTLGCAFAFAGHIIVQDRVSDKGAGKEADLAVVPFEQLALLQVGFCTLVMAATTPLLEKPYIHWTGLLMVTLVIEAVFATAAAFTIQSWAQKFLAPTYLVLIYAMEPVFAWLTSLAVLHQGLSARAGWGAVLILAGVLAAEFLGNRSGVTDSAPTASI
jgi:drug/metabolite transporter (DMT)-like permease